MFFVLPTTTIAISLREFRLCLTFVEFSIIKKCKVKTWHCILAGLTSYAQIIFQCNQCKKLSHGGHCNDWIVTQTCVLYLQHKFVLNLLILQPPCMYSYHATMVALKKECGWIYSWRYLIFYGGNTCILCKTNVVQYSSPYLATTPKSSRFHCCAFNDSSKGIEGLKNTKKLFLYFNKFQSVCL
jgi:hypothetical protein